jgi:catechol 2,3-dioxygenase-like lactoylglutathione lyase family enzyme
MAHKLVAAYPQLFTTDMARWRDYYVERLGFAVAFMHGDPPFYGQVLREEVRLNIRHIDIMPDRAMVEREVMLSAYIETTDVAALFAEYDKARADFQERLTIKPWGRQEFVVRDPDGNLLAFAGV